MVLPVGPETLLHVLHVGDQTHEFLAHHSLQKHIERKVVDSGEVTEQSEIHLNVSIHSSSSSDTKRLARTM